MAASGRIARAGRTPAVVARQKSNAVSGFAKRQAKKGKGPALDDVYEFQQPKQRRSRTTVDTRLGREEAAEFGFAHGGDGGEDDVERAEMRARLIGEQDEDEGLGSDEDEEIDSDAAFEEEDDDRYAGFNFPSAKKSTTSRPKESSSKKSSLTETTQLDEVDLDEGSDDGIYADEGHASSGDDDAEEDREEEEEGMVDLLDILDGKAKPYFAPDSDDEEVSQHDTAKAADTAAPDDDSVIQDNEDSSGSEDHAGDDTEMLAASDDDSPVAEEALDHLSHFISGLDASNKRKVDEMEQPAAPPRPTKRRVKEVSEGVPESEFVARMPAGSQKLNLEDLLAPLTSRPSSELQALKRSTKVLSASKKGTLSAPLATRAQERLDREAAYEQTKEEVDKWSATMKRIKEAEHLSFPLQQERPSQTSNLELNAKFKPTTELESGVDRLLKASGLRQQDLQQTEELKMNHLTPEEIKARHAEVSQRRNSTFEAERKSRRVKKIKSKAYHRIRRGKERKMAEKLGDAAAVHDLDDEEVRMRLETERARERATLRHKNTGKWARAMRGRNELDVDQRQELNDDHTRAEKLRRRIQGIGSGEEDSDSDDSDSDADIEAVKAAAFDELRALRAEGPIDPADGVSKKSVLRMKFMQDAMKRDMHRVNQSIDDFMNEMGGQMDSKDRDGSEPPLPADGEASVQRSNGRVSYRPGQTAETGVSRQVRTAESNSSSATLRSTDAVVVSPSADLEEEPVLRVTPPSADAPSLKTAANPWLAARDDVGSSRAVKRKEIVISKDSSARDKSKHKLRKQVLKTGEEQEKARTDAELEISVDNVLLPAVASASAKGKGKTKKSAAPDAVDNKNDEHDSEVEFQEQLLQRKVKKSGAFQQRDLVAAAFAGDNVVQDFAQAKQREIQDDAPQEIDTTLPGWGSWGGRGMKKQAPKPHLIKKVAGVDPKSRADYGKAHVIISEKRDKKAAKYLVKDLPYPYTSQAQFERSLSTPLGIEWNTRVGFQRGTLPKVVKKMGTIINPLEKLV